MDKSDNEEERVRQGQEEGEMGEEIGWGGVGAALACYLGHLKNFLIDWLIELSYAREKIFYSD